MKKSIIRNIITGILFLASLLIIIFSKNLFIKFFFSSLFLFILFFLICKIYMFFYYKNKNVEILNFENINFHPFIETRLKLEITNKLVSLPGFFCQIEYDLFESEIFIKKQKTNFEQTSDKYYTFNICFERH